MKVDRRQFSLPLARPVETAAGTVDRREGFLVRVGADGWTGVGEAAPLPGWTEDLPACRDALDDLGPGFDDDEVDAVLDRLGGTPAARHGLALALADREARRAGEPLYRHLGGGGRVRSVPVNATVGRGSLDETVEAAREAVAAGFGCVKVKVGGRPVEDDVARLEAVRGAVGPDVSLRADANGAWSREVARRAFEALAGAGVDYVEEPLPPGDLEGLADLGGGPVGVAVDETLTRRGPAAVVEAGAADVLVVKPMAHGGPDRARDVLGLADDAGLRAVVTTTVDTAVARLGAVHLAASLDDPAPAGLATAHLLDADVAPDPAPVDDGRARVPQGPGHGVSVTGWSP